MDQAETLRILAAYPMFYRDMTPKEATGVVALRAEMFDEPYPVVAAAVKALIATDSKGYPPHIGAVKTQIRRITQPQEMTEAGAWSLINRAIRNSAYGSQGEFDQLPPMLQRLVGSPNQLREWATMDTDTVQSVVASNFQRSFRARSTAERNYATLPADVRALSESLGGKLALKNANDM